MTGRCSPRARGLTLAAALVLALACGLGSGNDWVADVDGKRIELATLRAAVDQRAEDEAGSSREEIEMQELDRLLNEQVVLNRAAELGISVADQDVLARVRQLAGGEPAAADPAYRETVRREMTLDRTALADLADKLDIADNALSSYFETHRDRYREPARVRIRQIVVEDEAQARHLLGELRAGSDFAILAKDSSRSPEAAEGGLLPPYAKGEMPEVFDRAFDLRPGALSEVIDSPYGFHIFRLEEQIPAQEPAFEDVRARVQREVIQQRLEELRSDWQWGLRKQASIRLNEGALETLR